MEERKVNDDVRRNLTITQWVKYKGKVEGYNDAVQIFNNNIDTIKRDYERRNS